MTASLTLPAALLMGLAASGHCLLMCGGIASASGVIAMPGANRQPPLLWLVASQLGRLTSYALAGAAAASLLGGAIGLVDSEAVRSVQRMLMALALVAAAAVVSGLIRDPGRGVGQIFWRRIGPLARRLLPLRSTPAAFGFGMVWGWMPCGHVYSVLVVATLAADAWQAAATMALFGLGTLPAMLAISVGASRLPRLAPAGGVRRLVGVVLLVAALVTAGAPWLDAHRAGQAGVDPLHASKGDGAGASREDGAGASSGDGAGASEAHSGRSLTDASRHHH